jgi:hypothetical protein
MRTSVFLQAFCSFPSLHTHSLGSEKEIWNSDVSHAHAILPQQDAAMCGHTCAHTYTCAHTHKHTHTAHKA